MKFKRSYHIDVIAINPVLARKLCSFTRIYLGPTNILNMFCTVLQVLLYYINTCAGLTSSLRKFCRDHPRRKSNTSIKKRSPHQQHHTGSRNQRGLRRCGARASIIFPLVLLPLHLPTNYQHTIVIAGCPGPLVPIGETGKELICRSRARCRLMFFHNSIPM